MPLDSSIILGAKNPQFDLAQFSPVNTLASAMKLKQLEQEGEINSLTLGERKRLQEFIGTNPDMKSEDTRYRLATGFGESGRKLATTATDIGKAGTEEAKRRNDLVVSKTNLYRDALRDVSDQRGALQWLQAQKEDPDMAGSPVAKLSLMDAASSIPADPAGFADWKNKAALGLGEYIKQNKPQFQQVNRYGQTDLMQTPGLGGAPTTIGSFGDVPLPAAVEAQKVRIGNATKAVTNIKLPAQESAFETGLGKGQSERILANQVAAQDAASIIDTVKTGRDIMKSGMITGAGADFLVNLNQGLKTVGIDAGLADAAANSQAFTANMAGNVGKLIKQFGAGTGLSDADREFAKDMAGGRIALDAKAINRILDINEKAARNTINRHNKDVAVIKTNIPLTVEMPEAAPAAPAVAAPPLSAVSYLRANPTMKSAFDAKYGAGAADRALKGK